MTSVLLVGTAAPYLGGPQTWKPLRAALPSDWNCVELDPLDLAEPSTARLRAAIAERLEGVDLVIAPGLSAGPAMEAVVALNPQPAVLLLAPMYLKGRRKLIGRLLRPLLGSILGSELLGVLARRKMTALRNNRAFVRRQLQLVLRDDAITEELLDEAVVRVRDPRTQRAVEGTAAMMRDLLHYEPDAAPAQIARSATIAGAAVPSEKLESQGFRATRVIPGGREAPMIENPGIVAEMARELLSG